MRLTIQKLIDDTMALGRCLMVDNPDSANEQLAVNNVLSRKQLTLDPEKNHWIRLVREKHIGYIFVGADGAGRYCRDLIPGVNPNSLITIEITSQDQPGFALLEELGALLDALYTGTKLKISDSNEIIELDNAQEHQEVLASLLKLLSMAKCASTKEYNCQVVADISRRLRNDLLSCEKDAGIIKKSIKNIANEIEDLRLIFGADARLAGWFMIFHDVCIAVEDFYKNNEGELRSSLEMARYAGFATAGLETNPEILTSVFVEKLVREDLQDIASNLAGGYLRKGENLVKQAIESTSFDYFGGALYAAGLYFVASHTIYKTLAEITPNEKPGNKSEFYARASDVAEEKRVLVNTSFINSVENRLGDKLISHQEIIAKARKELGDDAAKQQVYELIDMKYYYPRYFEKILLNS